MADFIMPKTHQLIILIIYSPDLSKLERAFFYVPHPLIDRASGNDATSLTTYTTHTRASGHKKIYIVRTRGKAIIGMALRAIIIEKMDDLHVHKLSDVANLRATLLRTWGCHY